MCDRVLSGPKLLAEFNISLSSLVLSCGGGTAFEQRQIN